jgi:hypothetical protein
VTCLQEMGEELHLGRRCDEGIEGRVVLQGRHPPAGHLQHQALVPRRTVLQETGGRVEGGLAGQAHKVSIAQASRQSGWIGAINH